jgi:Protein of unknown function (DUF4031)
VSPARRRVVPRRGAALSIWIDPPRWPAHARLWSHLISDTSFAELHEFAAAAGVPARAFEGDHYDVPQERYDALVAAGAHPVEGKELVRILLGSGLRIQKRKGERVILSRRDAEWMPPPNRFDVIVSTQPHPPPVTVRVRLLVVGPRASVALAHRGDGGLDLPVATVADGESPVRALAALAERTVSGATPPTLIGYARNTVLHPDPTGYPWPVPQAAFVVFRCTAGSRSLVDRDLVWQEPQVVERECRTRHWWPLYTHEMA